MRLNDIRTIYKNRLLRIGVFVSSMLWGAFASAQAVPHTLWFHSLNESQGSSQSYNWYVFKDSRGFVWISSIAGLNRFDGNQVKTYVSSKGDGNSMLSDHVYSDFFEDSHSNIWFSTPDAIHCYVRNSDQFRHYFMYDQQGEKIKLDYQVYHLEDDSLLWVGNSQHIYRFNTKSPKKPVEKIADSSNFRCKVYKKEGVTSTFFSYAVFKGLEVHTIGQGKQSSVKVYFQDCVVNDVLVQNENLVWLATDKLGVIAWNPTTNSILYKLENLAHSSVYFALWQQRYLLLSVRYKGILILDTETRQLTSLACRFLSASDDAVNGFTNLYLDPDQNLWVSDENNGIYYSNLQKTKFRSLPKQVTTNNNPNYAYWAIEEGQNSDVWVAACPGGVYQYDEKGRLLKHYYHDSTSLASLPSDWVFDIKTDKKGRVWAATLKGLAWIDPVKGTVTRCCTNDSKANIQFIKLLCTHTGNVLAISESKGIWLAPTSPGHKEPKSLLLETEATYQGLFEDRQGRIFCSINASAIAVFQLAGNRLQLLKSLPIKGMFYGLQEDASRNLLFFATDKGLVQMDENLSENTIIAYDESQGLPGKLVAGMVVDADNNLWLGTNKGLAYFDAKQKIFRKFSRADGIQSMEFDLGAYLKKRNGEIWFGGSNGITIIHPDWKVFKVQNTPKCLITGLKINDEAPTADMFRGQTSVNNFSELRFLELPYGSNTLTFEFVALDYSDPANNQLLYCLVGRDDNWVELNKGKPGFVRYSKLSPGIYSFWVKALNSEDVDNGGVMLMGIRILPPWYMTWWFKTFCVFALAGAVYSVYRYRVAQIKKEAEEKRKEAEFKQKEAELRQLEAEARQQAAETETAILRLQMNPHFIFNCLNSINGYILERDINSASDYLGRFATLMRLILNNSSKPYISITKEIQMLDQYLQTEAMRFEKKFTYSFETDPSLDPDETIVPTMILQPFVENAIWHGISKIAEEGRIIIRFIKNQNHLTCSVSDNGIGIETALENKGNTSLHESKALAITQRRLELLPNENEVTSGFEVLDLKNANPSMRGTQVLVHLPFL